MNISKLINILNYLLHPTDQLNTSIIPIRHKNISFYVFVVSKKMKRYFLLVRINLTKDGS